MHRTSRLSHRAVTERRQRPHYVAGELVNRQEATSSRNRPTRTQYFGGQDKWAELLVRSPCYSSSLEFNFT